MLTDPIRDSLSDAQSVIYRMLSSTGELSDEAQMIDAGKAGWMRTTFRPGRLSATARQRPAAMKQMRRCSETQS